MQMNAYIHRRDMPWAHERPRLPRLVSWGLGLTLAATSLLATAQAAPNAPASAQPNAAEAALIEQAQQWLSGSKPGQSPDANILFAPLDPRLQIQGCQGPIRFYQPFPSQPASLRARCLKPDWTVFLQRTDAAASASAQAAARPAASRPTPAGPSMRKVVVALANLSANQPVDPALF